MHIPRLLTTSLPALLLAGCTAAPVADGRLQIAPVERIRHAMHRSDALYQTGRYFQGQIRYEQAIAAYREALAANPDHVPALNGLAVVHASLGRFAEAEAHFQQALALAPGQAYLYNNLGYAYLRAGRVEAAQAALAKAVALAPDDDRYAANFALATETLARRHAPAIPVASGAPATAAPPRLEIANGNGVRGSAARTAGLLRQHGLPAARLTNERPFLQQHTEIHYLAGRRDDAQRIDHLLPVDARLVEIRAMQRGTELRIVLGHDLRRSPQRGLP